MIAVNRPNAAARASALLAAALTAACGASKPAPVEPPVSTERCATTLRADLPELPPAPDAPPTPSTLGVRVRLSKQRLSREIARAVPKVVATERKRKIGAPGLVTYSVTRGAFSVAARNNTLGVSTPLSAKIEVCKPIGPFCPVYGRCSPELSANVAVPLKLTHDYDLGPSHVSVAVTRRCVLQPVGLDVTGQLEQIARDQARPVARQVDRAVPPLRANVERVWRALGTPLALDATTCLRVLPDAIIQGEATEEADALSATVAVRAFVSVEMACTDLSRATKPGPLPAPAFDASLLPGLALALPLAIDLEHVTETLTRALGTLEGTRATRVAARGVQHEGSAALLVELDLEGSVCGSTWMVLGPEPSADGGQIEFRLRAAAPDLDPALQTTLAAAAVVAVPIDVGGASARLRAELDRWLGELTTPSDGVRVALALDSPRVDHAVVTPAALVTIVHLTGQATVHVE